MLRHMPEMPRRSISQLRQECRTAPLNCRLRGQVDELNKKESANGKPFWELKLRDSSDALTLRAWTDTAAFDAWGLEVVEAIPDMTIELTDETYNAVTTAKLVGYFDQIIKPAISFDPTAEGF